MGRCVRYEHECETVRGISGLKVINQTATVKDGAITEYRANVKISFVVADVRE